MTWTDERVDELKGYWNDGWTGSQIAAEFGDVTRNAVIGKLNRLGLSGTRPVYVPRPKRQTRRHRGWVPSQREIENVPDIPDLPPDRSSFACTIAELGSVVDRNQCRWPLGEPAADMQYCAAPCIGSWCGRHGILVFTPMVTRRRR